MDEMGETIAGVMAVNGDHSETDGGAVRISDSNVTSVVDDVIGDAKEVHMEESDAVVVEECEEGDDDVVEESEEGDVGESEAKQVYMEESDAVVVEEREEADDAGEDVQHSDQGGETDHCEDIADQIDGGAVGQGVSGETALRNSVEGKVSVEDSDEDEMSKRDHDVGNFAEVDQGSVGVLQLRSQGDGHGQGVSGETGLRKSVAGKASVEDSNEDEMSKRDHDVGRYTEGNQGCVDVVQLRSQGDDHGHVVSGASASRNSVVGKVSVDNSDEDEMSKRDHDVGNFAEGDEGSVGVLQQRSQCHDDDMAVGAMRENESVECANGERCSHAEAGVNGEIQAGVLSAGKVGVICDTHDDDMEVEDSMEDEAVEAPVAEDGGDQGCGVDSEKSDDMVQGFVMEPMTNGNSNVESGGVGESGCNDVTLSDDTRAEVGVGASDDSVPVGSHGDSDIVVAVHKAHDNAGDDIVGVDDAGDGQAGVGVVHERDTVEESVHTGSMVGQHSPVTELDLSVDAIVPSIFGDEVMDSNEVVLPEVGGPEVDFGRMLESVENLQGVDVESPPQRAAGDVDDMFDENWMVQALDEDMRNCGKQSRGKSRGRRGKGQVPRDAVALTNGGAVGEAQRNAGARVQVERNAVVEADVHVDARASGSGEGGGVALSGEMISDAKVVLDVDTLGDPLVCMMKSLQIVAFYVTMCLLECWLEIMHCSQN